MSTLLMRMVAPMQSWGVQSRFTYRDTGLEPSKSGIIGLLCAALGRPRSEATDDLVALRMAVRVDREGKVATDYHTAKDVKKASGGRKPTEVSYRYYLSDAAFLVGLSGDPALLTRLHNALSDPVWPLYLGRKAFVPSVPVWMPDGLRLDESLEHALLSYPWLGRGDNLPKQVRVVWDAPQDGNEIRTDHPISFEHREFIPRRVKTTFEVLLEVEPCTSPD